MDVYRRLTRCTSLEMLAGVEQDVKDAFGEPPRQAIVLFRADRAAPARRPSSASTASSRKSPDVVLTVRDAAKAQHALHGAPGTLRVIDEKTVYLRMPPTYLEPETCLMVLKNLMRKAYDRMINGVVEEKKVAVATPQATVETVAGGGAPPDGPRG